MVQQFLTSDQNWALFILRVILGIVILPHGLQKLLGWYGGNGFSATMKNFTTNIKQPAVVAFLVIIGESFGSAGLILGLLTRLDALGLVITQVGAIFMVHAKKGFFISKGGYEYNLLIVVVALVILIWGGGPLSVDQWLLALAR